MPEIRPTSDAQRALLDELRAGLDGDARADRLTRGLYATDASIYQQDPIAVVFPRHERDVAHALAVAHRRRLPVLPRGAGTSLAGQATGRALVLDLSRHMDGLIEVDLDARLARVQPGLVRDRLNDALRPHGLHFGPETATADRANLGGMIGNNSSGTRSIRFGKTVDHVRELTVRLVTGERLHCRPMSRAQWDAVARRDDREGAIYRGVRDIVEATRDEVARRFPKVMRRVGGYNLDAFPPGGPWNLASLVVGSEGTLATVVEATVALVPPPAAEGVAAIHFRDLRAALRAVAPIVGLRPLAVEILDRHVITLARESPATRHLAGWIDGEPEALLLVGLDGDDPAGVEARWRRLDALLRRAGGAYAWPLMTAPAERDAVWRLRAAGLGLLLGMKGDAKPIAFIEDAAVPLPALPDYIAEVTALCRREGAAVAMYAHASVGLIHVRPILDLKRADDVARMRRISEGAFELVRRHGGAWSGEHGDGLVRSYLNRRFFGDRIYGAFQEVKRLFDPDGLMNPGKIVDAPPMDRDLRLGPAYRARPPATFFHFRAEGGMDRAVELCTGVGACRKLSGGTMCPSFRATRDEAHATRGRANALRLALSGQLGEGGLARDDLHETLDLCLACKGCKGECPSNVDLARLKAEALAARHAASGPSPADLLFARSREAAALLSGPLAPLANGLLRSRPARALLGALAGLDPERPLPPFARDPFHRWFRRRRGPAPGGARGEVVLFDDTFTRHHEPGVGRAAVRLLEALGYRVTLAAAGCCCRPLVSLGFLDEARREGGRTLARLDRHLSAGVPVVVLEPSCWSALTDDLPDLVADAALGERARAGVLTLPDFLAGELGSGRLPAGALGVAGGAASTAARIVVHPHCHQRALSDVSAIARVLRAASPGEVHTLDAGCCGMAGAFGYLARHREVSRAVAEEALLPAVRREPAGTLLVASGFSCRHQVADLAGRTPHHLAEALAPPGEM